MKNSILILCLLFAGVTFGQDIFKSQTIQAFESDTDSIVVYKVSDTVYEGPFRFLRAHKFRKHESLDGAEVISVMYVDKYAERFTSKGVYAFLCFRDGVPMKPTFLHVDDRYVRSGHKDLQVGHRKYHYYSVSYTHLRAHET